MTKYLASPRLLLIGGKARLVGGGSRWGQLGKPGGRGSVLLDIVEWHQQTRRLTLLVEYDALISVMGAVKYLPSH